MKKNNLIIIFLISTTFTLLSCQNKKSNNEAKVSFVLPKLSKKKSTQAVSIKSTTGSTHNYFPTTMSQINCYAIAVGGPEATLSRSYCTKGKDLIDATGTVLSTSTSLVKFGILKGMYPEGSTISLSVPAGSNRKFYLIGFEATDTKYCTDFNSNSDNEDQISDPYIIGESASINLQADTDNKVSIPIPTDATTLTGNYEYLITDENSCVGPDIPNNENSGEDKTPAKIVIEKNNFPYNMLASSKCNIFRVKYLNSQGYEVTPSSTETIDIEMKRKDNIGNWNSYTATLAQDSSCGTNLQSLTGVSVVGTGTNSTTYLNSTFSFDPDYNSSYPSYYIKVKSNLYNLENEIELNNINNYKLTTQIIGPKNLLPNTCYQMRIKEKFLSNLVVDYNGTFSFLEFSPSETQIYPTTNCTGASLPSANPTFTYTNSYTDFSIKTPNLLGKQELTVTTASSQYNSVASTQTFKISRGKNEVKYLELYKENGIVTYNSSNNEYCIGPIYAQFVNEKRQAVPSSGGSISISTVSPSLTSGDTFDGITENCSSADNPYTRTLASSEAGFAFYLKMTLNNTSSNYSIQLSATGTLNGASFSSENSTINSISKP